MNKIPFILLIGTVASCFQEETVEEKTVPYQTEKYESGQLKASYEVFADGTKNGRYKSFHENGEEESTGKYVNGKREGKWWFHDDQGNITYYGFYEDDARVGEWTSYSQEHPKKYGIGLDDGKLAEWTVEEGMSSQGVVVIGQGYSDEFGVRVAAWTWRYENGQVESSGNYWAGDQKYGEWTYCHENGIKRKEGSYAGDQEVGNWTHWDTNGNVIDSINHDGPFEAYFKSRESTGTYKNGRLDGLFTQWYESGQKQEEGHYKNGERTGIWTFWSEDGRLEKTEQYD